MRSYRPSLFPVPIDPLEGAGDLALRVRPGNDLCDTCGVGDLSQDHIGETLILSLSGTEQASVCLVADLYGWGGHLSLDHRVRNYTIRFYFSVSIPMNTFGRGAVTVSGISPCFSGSGDVLHSGRSVVNCRTTHLIVFRFKYSSKREGAGPAPVGACLSGYGRI